MGWNEGYKIMEATVIAVYDAGVLTPELLNLLMQPYSDSDMDSGGSRNATAVDGLSAEEIVCKLMEPERYAKIPVMVDEKPDFVKLGSDGKYYTDELDNYRYDTWQEALINFRSSEMYDLWRGVIRERWEIY